MQGIYDDSFIDYLKVHLKDVKITSRNIITKCPWCETGKDKHHYHLYISLEAPIFRCWHADCDQRGFITKLTNILDGTSNVDKYVDREKIKDNVKNKVKIDRDKFEDLKLDVPTINPSLFQDKELYIKQRFKLQNIDFNSMKGLIFDVNEFTKRNKLLQDENQKNLREYLHKNFVGFLSEHNSIVMFRNMDDSVSFKHFKLSVKENHFSDYYRVNGYNPESNHIVLGEGIYDIYTEQMFNNLGIKNDVKLYAATFSGAYLSVIKSIIFYEQMFRVNVTILSDKDVKLDNYKKLKRFNSHIIDKLTIYYNKSGKDFNVTPVIPEKFVL